MNNQRFLYWKEEPPERKWKLIPDTPEDRASAIQRGAMFFTWCSFSHEPGDGDEPVRFGDLPLDFDSKSDPQKALDDLRRLCLFYLPETYDIDPWDMKFYCSGSKGFHAVIPAHIFGLQDGHPQLPLIYGRLVREWSDGLNLSTVDHSMYAMKRGKLFRIENVRRSTGRYKVPLTRDDVGYCSIENLWVLSDSPRTA